MNENKKVLFIINKHSGTGYKNSVEGKIITHCQKYFIEPTLEFTKGRNHATELARQGAASKKFEIIFAVGGDGTLNEVAQGLIDTNQVMGILPKGSGNGLARHLGISMDFEKSLSQITSPVVIDMDTFLVNGKLSINVSGIGFDGHIANLFGKSGRRGLLEYSRLVVKEFLSFNEFNGSVTIDDKTVVKSMFVVAFANSSQFGNNARISPQASVCDGILDVCFVKKVPIAKTVGFIQKMFSGNLDNSTFTEIIKAKKINLSFNRPIPYHIDGEGMPPQQEFEIKIKSGSLRMIVPLKSQLHV
jgi:YegS/Rv2252/BmrU family lipid kinase